LLTLLANKIGPDALSHIIEALRVNSKIVTLNLGVNKFGPETTVKFCEVLRTNTTLTDLMIEGSYFALSSFIMVIVDIFASAICFFLFPLYFLTCIGNQIGNKGAGKIFEALEENSTLVSLNIDRVKFDTIRSSCHSLT
jgi:hypothetical protein